MPITPFHLGPGVFQKALAPRATNLLLYGVASLAIDAEPIIKGVAGLFGVDLGPLHTWTHQLEWMLIIALACAIVWALLRLTSWPVAVFTAAGAATTHWLLDSLMHGGGDMPLLYNTRGYGTDIAHGIAIWGFLLGTPFLIAYYRTPIENWLRRELRLPRSNQSRSIDGK